MAAILQLEADVDAKDWCNNRSYHKKPVLLCANGASR